MVTTNVFLGRFKHVDDTDETTVQSTGEADEDVFQRQLLLVSLKMKFFTC